MHSFKQFLSEEITEYYSHEYLEYLTEEKEDGDSKGKLLELLVGAAAHGGIKNGQVTKFPHDTREGNKKAKPIHDGLVKKLFGKEGTDSAGYKRIVKGAIELHKEWEKKNLKPGEKVVESHWTSQPSDLEKLTGSKDPNSKADVVHVIKDAKGNTRYAPVSLKIGQSDPNLANNGSKTLALHGGIDEKDLTTPWDEHTESMKTMYPHDSAVNRQAMGKMDEKIAGKEGIEGVRKYRDELAAKDKPSGQDKARLEAANNILNQHDKAKTPAAKQKIIDAAKARHEAAGKSSIEARSKIATTMATALNKGKPEERHGRIYNALATMAAPHTVHRESIAIAHEHKDGSIEPHVFDGQDFVRNHIDDYHSLRAESSGMTTTIHGINKRTNKEEKVAIIGMKQGNGPHTGWNSTMTFPRMIPKAVEREQAQQGNVTPAKKTAPVKKDASIAPPAEKAVTQQPGAKTVTPPTKKVSPAVQRAAATPQPRVSTPTKNKAVVNKLAKPSKPESEYDYKDARGQDLGRKAAKGDDKAQKELEDRNKAKAK